MIDPVTSITSLGQALCVFWAPPSILPTQPTHPKHKESLSQATRFSAID